MIKKIIYLVAIVFLVACKQNTTKNEPVLQTEKTIENQYAVGFDVTENDNYKIITLHNPWPNADKKFTYLLVNKGTEPPKNISYDVLVFTPVEKIVVTSTTHVAALDELGVLDKLIGFPNTNFVSSKNARKRIEAGQIKDVGENESINTEVLLDLDPDVVVGFAVNGNNKTFHTLEKAGIPVLYNAAWVEKHALGRAEWIKFFGHLFDKEKAANTAFQKIVTSYNEAKKIAGSAVKKPTIFSGSTFKDVWNIPNGNSWVTQFFEDAGGNYLWKDETGSGSLSLTIESVLDKAQQADYWITIGAETTKEEFSARNMHYKEFEAFQKDNTYIANATGTTGGLLFYELGPNRPDLILKDLIHIFHPELLADYEPVFYHQLK